MKEDYFSQSDDYDEPFYEQQYTRGSCLFCLFKFKTFNQFNPPERPQILDIRDLKQTDAAAERRRSHSNFLSIKE